MLLTGRLAQLDERRPIRRSVMVHEVKVGQEGRHGETLIAVLRETGTLRTLCRRRCRPDWTSS
jgi:hypothetical protein